MRETNSVLKSRLAAAEAQLTALRSAQPAASAPKATAVTGWLSEAKVAAVPKTTAVVVEPITYRGRRGTFKGIPGYYIVKFHGETPDSIRPDGKFLTLGEVVEAFAVYSRDKADIDAQLAKRNGGK